LLPAASTHAWGCALQCINQDIDKTKEDLEGILELFREFVRSNRPDLDVDKVEMNKKNMKVVDTVR